MHPHYYWLKKVIRQEKRQYLFPYKINASEFRAPEDQALLKSIFNIDSFEEFNDIFYIIVNEDKMKLPVGGKLSGDQTTNVST